MNELNHQINQDLKHLRSMIQVLPSGTARDELQKRFERVLDRMQQIPARIRLQFDAGFIRSDAEFDDIRRMELLAAIDSWNAS